MDRRTFIATGVGASALAASSALAQARLPAFEGVQRLTVGEATITALSDGHVDFVTPQTQIMQGISAEEYETLISQAGGAPGLRQTDINAYLVEIDDRKVMLDVGTNKGFAPTLGFTPEALLAAGHAPDSITDILITHLHPDHVGGLLSETGALYRNARVLVHEAEHEYWINGDHLTRNRPDMEGQFMLAKAALAVSGDRWETFSGPELGIPGISAVPLFGHTPGQVGCIIESAGQQVFVVADIVHQPAIQLANPAVGIVFDVDMDAARATREAILDRVASDGDRIIGMHMPFPGVGRIERRAGGFHWIAEEREYF